MRIPSRDGAGVGLVPLAAALLLLGACAGEASRATAEHEREHEDDHGAAESIVLTPEAYAEAGISVEPVVRRRLGRTIEVTGNLAYDERRMAVATARIGGRIVEVVADYGQAVSAGDVLAWIDSPELGAAQAELRRALGLTRMREAEHERARLLLEGQAISRGELLRREADWRAAQVELWAAEQKLHLLGLGDEEVGRLADDEARAGTAYPVRAAIAGKVTERDAAPGQVVSPDDTLFVVADLRRLWLFLKLFEKDLPSVTLGTGVTLSCESHPEDRFSGTLDFVGEVLDPHTRTIAARAVIDNRDGKLKPGMFVYAEVDGRDGDGDTAAVLAVPAPALTRIDERDVVFVETGERTFEARPVRPGRRADDWSEILEGLAEGERIVSGGTFTLKSEALKGDLAEHDH